MGSQMMTTIVTACATVTVAVATIYYAISTHKMLNEMRKDRERPRIVGRVKMILTPFIAELNSKIAALERKAYCWVHDLRRPDKLVALEARYPPEIKIILSDLLREFPHIKEAIAAHNRKIEELQEKLSQLDQVIYGEKFETKCQVLFDEFNENAEEGERLPFAHREAPTYLVSFIIDNFKELPQSHKYHKFWEQYGNSLLKIREEESVKQKITEVEEASRELEHIVKLLKDKLEQLKEQYHHEYNLSPEELGEPDTAIITRRI